MERFISAENIEGTKYVEDKSIFISFAYYCEGDYKDKLKFLKSQYPDATHICYAFRYFDKDIMIRHGEYREYTNSSDAGEPSGTAGIPILAAIKSAEANNVLVCVVRYFGGNKLGANNLARAYGHSASLALQDKVEYSLMTQYRGKFSYSEHNTLYEMQNRGMINIVNNVFEGDITCEFQAGNKAYEEIKRLFPNKEFEVVDRDFIREDR